MKFIICCFILLSVNASFAQSKLADSLQIEIGTVGTIASKDYQPLWMVSNRFGTITDQKTDLSSNIKIRNRHSISFSKTHFIDSTGQPKKDLFYVSYGVNLYNNDQFKKLFLEEGYIKAGYKNWQIRGGRFEDIPGDLDKDLSSGSLGISGNALPIPKVGIIVTDYIPVPFTNGWLSFKGQLSHGWFGNNRYMKDAFYHEKNLYLQVGKRRFKLYGGIQHYAEWGGRRGAVQLERSWKGFIDVLLVKEADDGSVGTSINGILPNRPGDQRGLLEAGFKWENEKILLHGYQQTPFETGRDIDIRNVDRLVGLSVILKKSNFLKKALLEFIYTKRMLDFVPSFDRQSFYNNGYYKTGWEYENRIIGTPLFINRRRGINYSPDFTPFDWNAADNSIPGNSNIINNRIAGIHIGTTYNFSKKFTGKTILTFTQNYGTYDPLFFAPNKDQLYTLQQLSYQTVQGLTLTAGIALDSGELTKNAGFMFGIKKQFREFGKVNNRHF